MPLYGSLTVTNPDLLQVPITPLQILDTSGKPSGHIDPTQWNVFIQTLSRVTSNPGAFSSGTGFNYIPINYSQYNDGALPTMSGTATVTYDTGFHIFGAASLKVTNSGTVYFASTSTTYPFGIAPSLTWIISAYCKSDVASAGGTIGIKTATGTYSVPFTASAVAGDTTRIYGILDLSADTGTAFDVEIVSSAGTGKNIWFDGFMLEPQSGSSDVPSPYSTNTPSTVLNVDPSGGVINNLPLPNHAGPVTSTITGTADANGNYLISGSTSALTDDAALGLTATYGQVSSLPSTLSGYGITDGQNNLGNASGIQILKQNGGTNPFWSDQYDPNINLSGNFKTTPTTLSTSTGVFSVVSNEVEIPVPSNGIALLLLLTCRVYMQSITGAVEVLGEFEVSTDGGSTWTGLSEQLAYASTDTMFPWSDIYFYSPASATGSIVVRYKMERLSGTSGNININIVNLNVIQIPYSNFVVLSGPLSASIPTTAAGPCSAYYPTTTCSASANITCTPSGGSGGNTFSWAKVSGTGTITNSTSQTCTVTDTETTSDAGATYNTVVKCTVTDSALSTATSGNCTFTGTYTRLYNPIVVSVPTTVSSQCSNTCGVTCTASVNVTAAVSGGDGSYSHSWTRVSGTTMFLTNTTTSTVTVSYSASTTLVGANYSEVIKDTVTDGHSSTGSASSTVTLTFKCYS